MPNPVNNIKHIPFDVNAQRYEYSGERISIPFSRNDFYKIWFIENKGRLLFNNKNILIDKPALVLTNPLVPYAYDSLSKKRKGYWCVFKKNFLNTLDAKKSMQASPLFNAANVDVFFPNEEQQATIKRLFEMLIAQCSTTFSFRDDMIRNYVHLLIYEGLKIQNSASTLHNLNAATRIATAFQELLESQFPIQSPEQPLLLRKAGEFAAQLSVHVNHLNFAVQDVTGKSTTAHIAERIMNEAKALLRHSNWNIADIAYSLGFDYPNHFNTYFKKHEGITPTNYRTKSTL
jgi:AraC family transcriptional regulator, transcriptional activator of pobA